MSSSRIKIVFQVLILLFVFFSMKSQTTDSLKLESKNQFFRNYRQVFWDNLPKPHNWINDYENLFSNEEN